VLAGALATETAIIHNFLLNDRWTFRTARAPVTAAESTKVTKVTKVGKTTRKARFVSFVDRALRIRARHYPLVQRLLRFNGVALGGMAITVGLLAALTALGQLHLLLANLLAVGIATAWNYFVNSRWTWRDRSATAPALTTADVAQHESLPTYTREDLVA
jgi:putative flippase GtrA